MTPFGEYLKMLRERAGISQEALASEAQISSAYISQIESGRRNPPTPDVLRRMAAPLNVPYLVLMRQAGYLHDSELEMLLLRAIKALFAQEPGRSALDGLLRDSIERWMAMDEETRAHVLEASHANHISEIILEALLQSQTSLVLAQLFPEYQSYRQGVSSQTVGVAQFLS
ncbi:MAG: helix-turn-helix domain-containing protein [Ardenticatenaceae bacterium]